MIRIGMLSPHASSPVEAFGNPRSLAKRLDLFTGDDFYFGFASSRHTFLDIIGGHQPLAIKHGPILSIYCQNSTEGHTCKTSYIDVKNGELVPLIEIVAKAGAAPTAVAAFGRLLPWSFNDAYTRALEEEETLEVGTSPEEVIRSILEQLAQNIWPEDPALRGVPELIRSITEAEKDLTVTVADLLTLKERLTVKRVPPTAEDFMAPYDPLTDNERITIRAICDKNPHRITARHVGGRYPRIEIIIPEEGEPGYITLFESEQAALYSTFQDSLTNRLTMQELLITHFPDKIKNYLEKHGLDTSKIPERRVAP